MAIKLRLLMLIVLIACAQGKATDVFAQDDPYPPQEDYAEDSADQAPSEYPDDGYVDENPENSDGPPLDTYDQPQEDQGYDDSNEIPEPENLPETDYPAENADGPYGDDAPESQAPIDEAPQEDFSTQPDDQDAYQDQEPEYPEEQPPQDDYYDEQPSDQQYQDEQYPQDGNDPQPEGKVSPIPLKKEETSPPKLIASQADVDQANEPVEVDRSQEPELRRGVVTVRAARVREGPGLIHEPVGRLTQDQEVIILDEQSGWYEISLPDAEKKPMGWVSTELIVVQDSLASKMAEDSSGPEEDIPSITRSPYDKDAKASADEKVASDIAPETASTPQNKESVKGESSRAAQFSVAAALPEPNERDGRQYLFFVRPGLNSVSGGPNLASSAFRLASGFAVEIIPWLFFEGIYNLVTYSPGKAAHEGGGGFRVQSNIFGNFGGLVSAAGGYSSFNSDDNVFAKGTLGFFYHLDTFGWYDILLGPEVEYNRVFLDSNDDIENLILGFSFSLIHSLPY